MGFGGKGMGWLGVLGLKLDAQVQVERIRSGKFLYGESDVRVRLTDWQNLKEFLGSRLSMPTW